jgi:N,N-dimethylformamidase
MGPGLKVESVESPVTGEYPGVEQHLYGGSHVTVPDSPYLDLADGFTITAWISPNWPDKGKPQALVTKLSRDGDSGYGLFVSRNGDLALWVGDGKSSECLVTGRALRKPEWYFVAVSFDGATRTVRMHQAPLGWAAAHEVVSVTKQVPVSAIAPSGGPLMIAASLDADGRHHKGFNGKIDAPRIFDRALSEAEITALSGGADPVAVAGTSLVADWDFSIGMDSQTATDRSANRLHGTVVNMPHRAVIGHNWSGHEYNHANRPSEYGAIEFHEEDIDDARWDVSVEYDVPEDARSGIFALKTTAGDAVDHIPFFIRPHVGKPQAKIAFLLETNTYLAYGNEHVVTPESADGFPTELVPNWNKTVHLEEVGYIVENGLHSMYDHKRDGSGVPYQTRKVPILNMRPDFIYPVRGGPHCMAADLIIADWMEQAGHDFDVFSAEDLHFDGLELLSPYNVLVLGSHPEYWSLPMLEAVEAYLAQGGRAMYLGGNGFYWVTSFDPERPHVIEIRRWGGTDVWEAEPGEYYHSTTGELGGIWRNRNRAPQKMFGVGFTAQGFDYNSPYDQMPDAREPRAAFIFEGVGPDELIGDYPSLMLNRGAAGDEIDRFDFALGTPRHALLLATSAGRHSKVYHHVIEEVAVTDSMQHGEVNPFVRSDLTFFEGPNGGGVFSVGSIDWCGVLSHNDYKNNVSQITGNVLRRFASDEPLPPAPS